ncbi:MAG: SUF system Fe-S cluster assembly regulator [Acidobacteriota bacterium]
MFRMTRQSDYGIVLMTRMSQQAPETVYTARDLAAETKLPLPMVSKILKTLAHTELLVSHRGIKGGYCLGRAPGSISVAEIISVLEGPIAITECSVSGDGNCKLEPVCPIRENWQRINRAVLHALEGITLVEMAGPLPVSLLGLNDQSEPHGAGCAG